MDKVLFVGDLVVIKKDLRDVVGIPYVGIIIGETQIIPEDIVDLDIDEIDSYNIYFLEIDTMYTIPKGCVEKLVIIQE
tara:strand:+ start:351 stop:584 length:234 start_codon:yes stop_codon:yes gene_type:complete